MRKRDEKFQRPLDEVENDLANIHELVLEAMVAHPKNKPLNKFGQEVPDPVPVAPPVGYQRQPTMVELIRDMIKRQASELAAEKGHETFEEAEDFDVEDVDPSSPYEEFFEPTPLEELNRRRAAAIMEEEKPKDPPPPPENAAKPPLAP